MLETSADENGEELCDNCGQPMDKCFCCCIDCGDSVVECACEEGPTYPAVPE